MANDLKNTLPAESALLDDGLRTQIKGVLGKFMQKLHIQSILDPGDPKSVEMGSLLLEIAGMSDLVDLSLYLPDENEALEKELQSEKHYPVTGLYLGEEGALSYTGLSFVGVPGGKELNSFIIGMYNCAGKGQPLDEASLERIGKLKGPKHLKIFVSLACHHCAETVILSQRIASLSPEISVQMMDAGIYKDILDKYHIERVPMLLLDNQTTSVGGKNLSELLDFLGA